MRGQTVGWTDVHCEHLFKIGSKLHAVQESVSDPSDILHSMRKYPVCHVCDDSCTYIRYNFFSSFNSLNQRYIFFNKILKISGSSTLKVESWKFGQLNIDNWIIDFT